MTLLLNSVFNRNENKNLIQNKRILDVKQESIEFIQEKNKKLTLDFGETVTIDRPQGDIIRLNTSTFFFGDDFDEASLSPIFWTNNGGVNAGSICTISINTVTDTESFLGTIFPKIANYTKLTFEAEAKATETALDDGDFKIGLVKALEDFSNGSIYFNKESGTANLWSGKSWQSGASNASTSNFTLVESIYNRYKITYESGSAKFYINDILKGTITTGLPTTNGIAPWFWVKCNVDGQINKIDVKWVSFKIER